MERPITRILLNTNGRRIAKDDAFLRFLQDHRERIEVYLQFDGFRPATHLALRGEDLAQEKRSALARLQAAGVWTTLVTTVVKGLNDDEVGDVLSLGLDTPRCAGLAIQPMFGSGRSAGYDPLDRVTPTGVLRRLGAQTGARVDHADFVPLPCSHKDCCDIAYFLRTPKGEWRSLSKLLGREELKRWIGLVSNTISFENASGAIKELAKQGVLQRVFSESQKVPALELAKDILSICDCVPGIRELLTPGGTKESLDRMAERTFRVTVKQFMDAHTFHEARIRQCCVHVGTFEEDPPPPLVLLALDVRGRDRLSRQRAWGVCSLSRCSNEPGRGRHRPLLPRRRRRLPLGRAPKAARDRGAWRSSRASASSRGSSARS